MFVFNQRSLRAFNEKTLVHYKKHATIMAVLMLICGICCLIYPIAAGVYLSYATGFMFLVCGFYSIYSLFSSGKKQLKAKFTYAFFAIAWLLLGYCFLVNPVIGMNSLAMVFAACLFWGGFFVSPLGSNCSVVRVMDGNIFIGIFDLLIAGVWRIWIPTDRMYLPQFLLVSR